MESPWWPNYHASSAKRQGVRILVWVDDVGILEAVITIKVLRFIAIKIPFRLCLVLNMNSIGSRLAPNGVVVFAGDSWDDAWLSISALVYQSKQIQNAQQVKHVYDDSANKTKQLYVAVESQKRSKSLFAVLGAQITLLT